MDEMKIGSAFMTGLISKLISSAVRKKFGCDAKISLNVISVQIVDGKAHAHLDIDATMDQKDISKFVSSMGL